MRRMVLAMLGAIALLVTAFSPAEGEVADVETSIEAWFRGSVIPDDAPFCVIGCPPIALPDPPRPEHTLHVGVTAGFEVARTYFVLDLSGLPPGRVVTGGTVRLPLAGLDAGTTAPELADMVACVVNGFVEPAEGGPADQAPPIGCSSASPLEFDEAGEAFTFDLAPFATGMPSSDELAVAIVASDEARQAGTWRAVFHGRDRAADDARPITARVTYRSPGRVAVEDAESSPEINDAGPLAPSPGVVRTAPPTIDVPEEEDLPAVAPAGPETPATAAQMAAPAIGGYAYPQVWLLPLIFLVVGGILARSLAVPYLVEPDAPRTAIAPRAGGWSPH